MNVILGKRQIILAALVLILGVAVYLNWQFSKSDFDLMTGTDVNSPSKNYGDAQLVNNSNSVTDYFTQARLDKEKARGEAVETLANTLKDTSLDIKDIQEAALAAAQIAKAVETENNIETMVKAKGFDECLAIISDDKIKIMVPAKELSESQVAQITDIVITEGKLLAENISIIEIN